MNIPAIFTAASVLFPTTGLYRIPLRDRLRRHFDRSFQRTEASLLCLGTRRDRNAEIWLDREQIVRHVMMLGATGSGKTEMLLSMMGQAIAWGGGGVFVDGKGDVTLEPKLRALAASVGREDDLLVIDFMTGAGTARSNTVNIFEGLTSDALVNLVVSLMDIGGKDDAMWLGRAVSMLTAAVTMLFWIKRETGAPITINGLREALNLRTLVKWQQEQLPEPERRALTGYLNSLPGFHPEKGARQSQTTMDQHGYLEMQFTRVFSLLADVHGSIFVDGDAEVDIEDVILNRRLLLVSLPTLEKSENEASKLGRVIMLLIKQMMAKIIQRGSPVRPLDRDPPFLCVFDEFASYVAEGVGAMVSQARSLGVGMVFSSQDLAQIKAAAPNEALAIAANTGTKIFLNACGEDLPPGSPYPTMLRALPPGEFIVMNRDAVAYGATLRTDYASLPGYGIKGADLFSGRSHMEAAGRSTTHEAPPQAVHDPLRYAEVSTPRSWLFDALREDVTTDDVGGGHAGLLKALAALAGMRKAGKEATPVMRMFVNLETGRPEQRRAFQ